MVLDCWRVGCGDAHLGGCVVSALQIYGILVGLLLCAAAAGFAIEDARKCNDRPRDKIKPLFFASVFLIAACGLLADFWERLS